MASYRGTETCVRSFKWKGQADVGELGVDERILLKWSL